MKQAPGQIFTGKSKSGQFYFCDNKFYFLHRDCIIIASKSTAAAWNILFLNCSLCISFVLFSNKPFLLRRVLLHYKYWDGLKTHLKKASRPRKIRRRIISKACLFYAEPLNTRKLSHNERGTPKREQQATIFLCKKLWKPRQWKLMKKSRN